MVAVFWGVVVAVVIFLITREFWCWYWKVNEMVEEMKKTNKILTSIYHNQSDNNRNTGNVQSVSNTQNTNTIVDKPKWSNDIPEL